MVKIGFVSLGCSKNLCDTEVMLHHLMEAGYEITPEETEAEETLTEITPLFYFQFSFLLHYQIVSILLTRRSLY